MDELRKKGLAKMNEVYGWEMPNVEGNEYFALTPDHLFGTIWTRPGLSMRDKRIMTLTVVTALGITDLAEIQANATGQPGAHRGRAQGDGHLPHPLPGLPARLQTGRGGDQGGQTAQEGRRTRGRGRQEGEC